ncbi:MAG: alpha/beta fold hydrolase [Thermaerobacter sp.]|nr:alpha/beta fold hydrolase [Thermaerobacter sp.]
MPIGGLFLERAGAPRLFIRRVNPEPGAVRAHLLMVHASMVHSEYYLPLAADLASGGVAVWLPDLRGHGRSGGVPGHLMDWRDHVRDLSDAYQVMQREAPADTPLLLGGESYGGLVAYLALQGRVVAPAASMLLSPALGLTFTVGPRVRWWLVHAGRALSWIRPLKPLGYDGISADPYIGHLIEHDRQASRHYTLGFLTCLLAAVDQAAAAPLPPVSPMLALLSAGDSVCDNRVAQQLLGGRPEITLLTLAAPQHSLVADLSASLAEQLLAWMDGAGLYRVAGRTAREGGWS